MIWDYEESQAFEVPKFTGKLAEESCPCACFVRDI